MHPATIRFIFLGVVCLAVGVGCRTPLERPGVADWSEEFSAAARLNDERHKEELSRLADTAPTEERRRLALFDLARLHMASGQIGLARELFGQLIDAGLDDHYHSRAHYELGRILYTHDGAKEAARAHLKKTILTTSPWAGADLALDFLLRDARIEERLQSFSDELGELARSCDDDRLASRMYLEQGKILSARRGRANAALNAFRTAYDRCRECAATDDALMEMASIYRKFGHYEAANEALSIVAARTQRSFFVGTYSSHRASDARFELGAIALEHQNNPNRAAEHFRRFLRDFPGHIRSDQAAWRLVVIEGRTGSPESHQRALQRFIDEYPRSRHLAEARTHYEELQ